MVKDCFEWEETGDIGDAYLHFDCEEPAIYGSHFPSIVEMAESTGFTQKIRIRKELRVPSEFDFENRFRSDQMAVCPVELILTLHRDSDVVEVGYQIDNCAKDHRIRLLVKADICSACSIADIPFDIVFHTDADHYFDIASKVLPNTSFAALENEGQGIAVYTLGQHEYEHLNRHTLAFTLLRSTGVISRNMETLRAGNGEQFCCPGNQCLRQISGRIGVHLYAGDYLSENLMAAAKYFRTPLLSYFYAYAPRKFLGGNTAVQESATEELFFPPDRWENQVISNDTAAFQVDGNNIHLTAFKKTEDGSALLIRLFHSGEEDTVAALSCSGTIFESSMAETKGKKLGEKEIHLPLHGKGIKTLLIGFD